MRLLPILLVLTCIGCVRPPAPGQPPGGAAAPGSDAVPTVLPAGLNLPSRYDSREFLRPCDISGLTQCVYDAVSIRFHGWASQEERQAAVDAVGGRVEGWSHATAEYFVRIRGDTAFVALKEALTTLRRLPQVELAVPYGPIELEPNSLRPGDVISGRVADQG